MTITAAALAAAHFVGEASLGHTIGGEVHHFYRHFLERWVESPKDSKTGPPHNHDLEEASQEALRDAVLVLLMELAGRIEPQKSWLTSGTAIRPGGDILAKDLFPGGTNPRRCWLDGPRKAPRGDRFQNLHRHLKLKEDDLRFCFAEGNVCKTLGSVLADALLEWTRFELQGQVEHPDFESLDRDGWVVRENDEQKHDPQTPLSKGLSGKGVPGAQHESSPITIAHAYCLFFREHLKTNPKVFRNLVADTLNEVRGKLDSLGANVTVELQSLREKLNSLDFATLRLDFTDFQQWLEPHLGEIKNLLAGVQKQFDTLARGQDEMKKQQGEILVAITTLRTEVARGNPAAQTSLPSGNG